MNLTTGFGPHLMMDCITSSSKIADLQMIFDFLYEFPSQIGMTKITQPYVFPYEGLIPEDRGITGTVIIAESHLSFHSFTAKNYFFFDVFSCKPFDVGRARDLILEKFEVQQHEVHYVQRGREFPRSAELDQELEVVHGMPVLA